MLKPLPNFPGEQSPDQVLKANKFRHVFPGVFSHTFGSVESVFANTRHNKRLTRLNHWGCERVRAQWSLNCVEHNIETLARTPNCVLYSLN